MPTDVSKKLTVKISLTLASILLVLSILGVADDLIMALGQAYVTEEAQAYLKVSEKQAKETFELLSIAKAGFGLIESSQGGISIIIDMQVQVGKVLVALTNLIDFAWEASLAGLAILFVTQLSLALVQSALPTLLFCVALSWFSYSACLLTGHAVTQKARQLLHAFMVIFVMLVYAVPMAIYGVSVASTELSAQTSTPLKGALSLTNSLYNTQTSHESLKHQTTHAVETLKQNREHINKHVSTLHTYIYQHLAAKLLELFILPLLLLLIFYGVFKAVLKEESYHKAKGESP